MNSNLQIQQENSDDGEHKILILQISKNRTAGVFSAPFWLIFLFLAMGSDGGFSLGNNILEQVWTFLFCIYPVVMILTIYIVKKFKTGGQIKFAMRASLLYWWLIALFVSLFAAYVVRIAFFVMQSQLR